MFSAAQVRPVYCLFSCRKQTCFVFSGTNQICTVFACFVLQESAYMQSNLQTAEVPVNISVNSNFDIAFQVSQLGFRADCERYKCALLFPGAPQRLNKKCWSQLMTWLYGAGPTTCSTAIAHDI